MRERVNHPPKRKNIYVFTVIRVNNETGEVYYDESIPFRSKEGALKSMNEGLGLESRLRDDRWKEKYQLWEGSIEWKPFKESLKSNNWNE